MLVSVQDSSGGSGGRNVMVDESRKKNWKKEKLCLTNTTVLVNRIGEGHISSVLGGGGGGGRGVLGVAVGKMERSLEL
jgi:hypothetical protein